MALIIHVLPALYYLHDQIFHGLIGGGGGPEINGQSLRGGSPSASTLSNYGLAESALQFLFNKAQGRAIISDPDYQGYYEIIEKSQEITVRLLVLIQFNKTQSKYDEVYDELKSRLGGCWINNDYEGLMDMYGEIPESTILTSGGLYGSSPYTICTIMYYLNSYDGAPEDTLAVAFMSIEQLKFRIDCDMRALQTPNER